MRSQYGVMEAIVACGFESRAPPPGEHSFTNTLIEVLDDWIGKRTFSASCLHAEILFQLKLKETRKGRERIKLEWWVTPMHINYTQDCKAPGIELCRQNRMPPPQAMEPTEPSRPSTFVDAMDIDFEESNTKPTPLSSQSSTGTYDIPHVLIKIGLEQNQPLLDAQQCLGWLESVPLLAKWVKIEGVYPSFSTLVTLSVPIPIWNMLPDHPACSFIGYVTASNLTAALPSRTKNTMSAVETSQKHDIIDEETMIPVPFMEHSRKDCNTANMNADQVQADSPAPHCLLSRERWTSSYTRASARPITKSFDTVENGPCP
jgi:hypothetical protein